MDKVKLPSLQGKGVPALPITMPRLVTDPTVLQVYSHQNLTATKWRDIHALLYSNSVVKKWFADGVK
jgi:hypothetical protein